jgi:hypothetical protein
MTRKMQWIIFGGGSAVAAFWFWRNQVNKGQVAIANDLCIQERALARESLMATTSRQNDIKMQIEAVRGIRFTSDAEWRLWVRTQSTSPCNGFT